MATRGQLASDLLFMARDYRSLLDEVAGVLRRAETSEQVDWCLVRLLTGKMRSTAGACALLQRSLQQASQP